MKYEDEHPEQAELLRRAARIARLPALAPISNSSKEKYDKVAGQLDIRFRKSGNLWTGIEPYAASHRYAYLQRAAWVRHCRNQVNSLVNNLIAQRISERTGLSELQLWVPEAEQYAPRRAVLAADRDAPGDWLSYQRETGQESRKSRSKRRGILSLPDDWMNDLWNLAVDREYKHLDSLATLICSGCRPAEVCTTPIRLDVESGGELSLTIIGVKVGQESGQPWRRLTMSVDGEPARHLVNLVRNGVSEIRCSATPAAFSMSIAHLAESLNFGRRISAYDIRHQRSADIRNIFQDRELVAAWLGHISDCTQSYYGKAPKSSGCRGPKPISVSVPRAIRLQNRKQNPTNKPTNR